MKKIAEKIDLSLITKGTMMYSPMCGICKYTQKWNCKGVDIYRFECSSGDQDPKFESFTVVDFLEDGRYVKVGSHDPNTIGCVSAVSVLSPLNV